MKVVYFKDREISFQQVDIPSVGKGEVLIKVLLAGICNTDLELFRGYYGFAGVAGHEFVGQVIQADKPELVGKRVVGDINAGCEKCIRCLAGDSRHCADRTVLGIVNHSGAFAEYLVLPAKNVFVVDDRIDDRSAVFAEPLAAALEISQQIHLTHRQRMLVMGDGKLGLLIALSMKNFCSHVVLLGKHDRNLKIAMDQDVETVRYGVDQPMETGLFDIVVEATGASEGVARALEYCKPEGTIIAKSTVQGKSEIDMAKVVVDEISIVGSRCGDIGLALLFLKQQRIDVDPLIEATFPFKQFEQAFTLAQERGRLKVLVEFDQGKQG